MTALTCTASGSADSASPTAGGMRPSTAADVCPVTLPRGDHRPRDPAGLGKSGYGNGELWVGLWPHGHIRATEDNVNRRGAIVMKFPWDRAVKGRLHITGHRVDAAATPLSAHIPDYGLTGFQPSALVFPTEGCWEVTGRVSDDTSLTFVTLVTVSTQGQ
jgi:hypothetical protein